jgi:serine/threonine protein kinase
MPDPATIHSSRPLSDIILGDEPCVPSRAGENSSAPDDPDPVDPKAFEMLEPVASFYNPRRKPTVFEYRFIEHLGRGAHSDVFLVVNEDTNEKFAAKVYGKHYLYRTTIGAPEPPIERLMREVGIMETINHPNCMPLVEILDDEETQSLILIVPHADDGALSAHSWKCARIPEETARFQFAQIARALRHIHSLNIIHRDLKPDNILKFKDGRVVLADFSVALQLEDDSVLLEDTDGAPAYYSPEQCEGERYLGKLADVWAFGMMLYVMIYGMFPFLDPGDDLFFARFMVIMERIVSREYKYPPSVPISPELRDLFSHVLDKNPKSRYSMEQVMSHPWLRDVPDPFSTDGG